MMLQALTVNIIIALILTSGTVVCSLIIDIIWKATNHIQQLAICLTVIYLQLVGI